ncbi:MAG: protein phosphatase 2C domain-containing protein [Flaviflexus sp.]|nr:protein phosphatase 2C domain-containing protein [Flaviflexus sp.]
MIEVGSASDVGLVRTRQEDRRLHRGTLIAVADGMGGLSRGDVAAQTAVDYLSQLNLIEPKTSRARAEIRDAVARANVEISRSCPRGTMAGTTLAGAVRGQATSRSAWLIFHVGDSRVYEYSEGEVQRLTRDHSLISELVAAGVITPEQAKYHPQRAVVTRAIGTEAAAYPDFRLVTDTGQIILACSDGVSDCLEDEEIARIIEAGLRDGEDLGEIAHLVVDGALAAGGYDNATVVLARSVADE